MALSPRAPCRAYRAPPTGDMRARRRWAGGAWCSHPWAGSAGLARLDSALWLRSGLRFSVGFLGFRLDFGWILASAGFSLILVWLDSDLDFILVGFVLLLIGFGLIPA